MPYQLLADALLLFHLAFVLFVVLGALLVWRLPRLVWLHLPAVMWGGLIEITGHVCPLTPLENHLRRLSGEAGYSGSFVEHYLLSILYPQELSRELQVGLGIGVIVINVVAYAVLWRRARQHERSP